MSFFPPESMQRSTRGVGTIGLFIYGFLSGSSMGDLTKNLHSIPFFRRVRVLSTSRISTALYSAGVRSKAEPRPRPCSGLLRPGWTGTAYARRRRALSRRSAPGRAVLSLSRYVSGAARRGFGGCAPNRVSISSSGRSIQTTTPQPCRHDDPTLCPKERPCAGTASAGAKGKHARTRAHLARRSGLGRCRPRVHLVAAGWKPGFVRVLCGRRAELVRPRRKNAPGRAAMKTVCPGVPAFEVATQARGLAR